MSKNPTARRRSTSDIIDFIEALPGGCVPQYAKLLNTTAVRISEILKSKEGQRRLVKKNLVRASTRGMFPLWAIEGKTERGALDGRDARNMMENGQLPKFIEELLTEVHEEFRSDALNFFADLLDQTAGKVTFESQVRNSIKQTAHYTNELVEVSARLETKSVELDRLEHLLDRSMGMNQRIMENPALPFNSARTEDDAEEVTATDESGEEAAAA